MSLALFFDTETTGLFDDRVPVDHPNQPHIVQLAAQLCSDDGAPISGFSFIIDNGTEIPERAAAVHGITRERAAAVGVPLDFAISAFQHLYRRADIVVAHNIKFDRFIIEIAIARVHGKIMPLRKPLFCTMEVAAPIVNLPPTDRMKAAGFNKPKPPKLAECVEHFFGEELAGAHDAMVDLTACRRVYFHLRSLEKTA
jgi:DNA polymerase-3 subunit epsilon